MRAADPASPSFLICTALGDGEIGEIPAADHTELDELLGRMAAACAAAGLSPPATVVWHVAPGPPRPMSREELVEAGVRQPWVLGV